MTEEEAVEEFGKVAVGSALPGQVAQDDPCEDRRPDVLAAAGGVGTWKYGTRFGGPGIGVRLRQQRETRCGGEHGADGFRIERAGGRRLLRQGGGQGSGFR